jgi:hypothetical protein
MSAFIAAMSGRYQMKRPSRLSASSPARTSSFKWNDNVAGDSFNFSAMAPGVSPATACSTRSRKIAKDAVALGFLIR